MSNSARGSTHAKIGQAFAKEAALRCRTELAQALATLQLTRAGAARSHTLIDAAIARMGDQLALEQLLARENHEDVRMAFVNMIRLISGGRAENARFRIKFSGLQNVADPVSTRMAILIGYHFLADALLRHREPHHPIVVRLSGRSAFMAVTVQCVTHADEPSLLPLDDTYEAVRALALAHSGRIAVLKRGRQHTVRATVKLARP